MLILILVSNLLFPTISYAQPSSRFPQHVTAVINGERHEAFNLGGFVELLRMDADLAAAAQELLLLREYKVHADAAIGSLYTALDLSHQQLAAISQDRNRLYQDWQRENLARRQAENKPHIGSWLGWSLAAGFGISTIVTSILLGLR